MIKPSTPTRSPSLSSSRTETTPSLNLSTAINSEIDDLQNFKKLEQTLNKFNSFKKNSTTKTNILRLDLLPYLRTSIIAWSTTKEYSDLYINSSTNVFIKWWTSLLNSIKDIQNMASLDRNCYLECISRILARFEWLCIEKLSQYSSILIRHNELLLETFEFAILRLSIKSISLSTNSFIGKVFAYAFIKLPNISKGLLFLLTTKIKNFELIYNQLMFDRSPNDRCTSKNSINLNKFNNQIINEINRNFPDHLSNLSINKPRSTKFKIEKNFLNSMYPPNEKIDGINDTKGLWCFRWSSLDHIDLFCSFMRHYLTLTSFYMRDSNLEISDLEMFGLPGFSVLLTHLYEILDVQIIQQLRQQQQQLQQQSSPFAKSQHAPQPPPPPPPPQPLELQVDKIFRLLREFISNFKFEFEMNLKIGFIKSIENIIKLLIFKTSIFEFSKINIMFEILIKFIKSIKEASPSFCDINIIDWEFWIDALVKLFESNNINCELISTSMFYQIWDYIPTNKYPNNSEMKSSWISDYNENLKFNLNLYLINSRNWVKYFGHYLSLVRCYYIRLVVWKLLGLNSLTTSANNDLLNFKDSINFKKSMYLIDNNLTRSFEISKKIKFKPTDPVLNKKFIINPINSSSISDSRSKKEAIRTHPYEILDDAVYSCANLSISSNNTSSSKLNSSNSSSYSSMVSSASSSPSRSTNNSSHKLSSKFNSTWVSRLFKRKDDEEARIQSQQQQQLQPPVEFSNKNGDLISSNNGDLYNELLKTPPKIFSSPSINFTKSSPASSSSPSLLSSITTFSSSSPQSSSSSFEFIQDSKTANGNNSSANNINFLPPELNYKPKELSNFNYKFQLVNNDSNIQNNFRNLVEINEHKFVKLEEFNNLIINEKPRLPKPWYSNSTTNKFLVTGDSNSESFDEEFNGLQLNFESDFLTELSLNPSENLILNKSESLTTTEKLLHVLDDQEMNNNRPKLKDSFDDDSDTESDTDDKPSTCTDEELTKQLNYCFSIHEYNNIVNEFESFIKSKIDHQNNILDTSVPATTSTPTMTTIPTRRTTSGILSKSGTLTEKVNTSNLSIVTGKASSNNDDDVDGDNDDDRTESQKANTSRGDDGDVGVGVIDNFEYLMGIIPVLLPESPEKVNVFY